MIGGTGQKILLRIVAEHADMWNAMGSPEELKAHIAVIRKHGDTVKRDTDQIEKTVAMALCYNNREREAMVTQMVSMMRQKPLEEARKLAMIGNKQEAIDTVGRFSQAGLTHFIFMLMPPYQLDEIQAFAEEVIPAFR